MTHELEIFNFEEKEVRTVIIDGEPWFIASDIATILDFRDGYTACRSLDDDEKDTHTVCTLGGEQEVTIINESGLYSLILKSRKEEAKRFKKWITSEVLPAIRKTGSYSVEQSLTPELQIANALILAANMLEESKLLLEQKTKQIEVLEPKGQFYDRVTNSESTVDIGEVAKTLNYKTIGRNKLFAILRDQKVLNKKNIPYQEYINSGYFKVIETEYEANNKVCVSLKTVVSQKGVDFINRLLDKID